VSAGRPEAGFLELGFSGPARAGELLAPPDRRGVSTCTWAGYPRTSPKGRRRSPAPRDDRVFRASRATPAFPRTTSRWPGHLPRHRQPRGGGALQPRRQNRPDRPRPAPGDLAFGLPPAGEGGNASLLARNLISPKFLRTGDRGASAAFTEQSLARRATCGWGTGPFRAGATLGTPGTASVAARYRRGPELNPAIPGKIAVRAMEPGAFACLSGTLSLRHSVFRPRFPRQPPGALLRRGLGHDAEPETPEPLPEHRVRPRDTSPPAAFALPGDRKLPVLL
jgi:hypothetical protein